MITLHFIILKWTQILKTSSGIISSALNDIFVLSVQYFPIKYISRVFYILLLSNLFISLVITRQNTALWTFFFSYHSINVRFSYLPSPKWSKKLIIPLLKSHSIANLGLKSILSLSESKVVILLTKEKIPYCHQKSTKQLLTESQSSQNHYQKVKKTSQRLLHVKSRLYRLFQCSFFRF